MKMDVSFPPQFCALEYRSSDFDAVARSENVIILVLYSGKGGTAVLVRPNWSRFVEERDREYIAEMIKDFEERRAFDPAGLLRQLSSLSVGPLTTFAHGSRLSDYPDLVAICSGFRESRKEDHEDGNDG